MAVPRKGWRKVTFDNESYYWRATGTDGGITGVVVTEEAFKPGRSAQQLVFHLDYDSKLVETGEGNLAGKQRAVVAPGVVRMAVELAARENLGFDGSFDKRDVLLSPALTAELQLAARKTEL